jgi:23S rRNA (guanosine2251-2'-O)-methyltransferase
MRKPTRPGSGGPRRPSDPSRGRPDSGRPGPGRDSRPPSGRDSRPPRKFEDGGKPRRFEDGGKPRGPAPDRAKARAAGRPQGEPRGKAEAWGAGAASPGQRPDRRPERGKPQRKQWRPRERDRDGPVLLYGWHSVKAALENPQRKFIRLLATENMLHRLKEENVPLPIEAEVTKGEEIDELVGPDAVHQGLLAEVHQLPSPAIDDVEPKGVILVLDQVTDPHNVGAILRSAAAFAVTAVVITLRHSPEMTGVLAKAASGALEHVPMIAVTNLSRALDVLKKKNVFVIGLDSSGDVDIASIDMSGPTAIVVGAEGKGLRHLTRENCDQVARLDLPGKITSLNVSNATALALYVATSGQKK